MPGGGRVHDAFGDIRAALGHLEAKDGIGEVFHLVELAIQGGVEHGARVADADALADAVGSAHPAGIEQPAVDIVAGDLAFEQVGVIGGVMHHEGTAETGAEGDLRLVAHTQLGAAHLGGIARDEVVEGLIGGETRQGRHHAGGIASQQQDVLGMTSLLLWDGVLDEFQRIGGARVLSVLIVIQVYPNGHRIVDHVPQQCAELAGAGDGGSVSRREGNHSA